MTLYALSIRRPVLATVMSIAIVIFGIIGFFFLGVREYPVIDPAVVSVSTSYRGANADVIDSQITEPLEEQINGIDGIRTLTSVSSEGSSRITVEFEIGVDLERAANDVRDRVSRAQRLLPLDADPPVVAKQDADATPIVQLRIQSDQRTLLELSDIADNMFKEQLQTIPGVSAINIWGEKKYAMRLWLDPQKLSAYQLTPVDVQRALQRSNIELPTGRIEGNQVEMTVRTRGRLVTPEDFNNLILKNEGGSIVRFKDVGTAELSTENLRSSFEADGRQMVSLVLTPLPGANHIEIADEFYKRLEDIKRNAPKDIQFSVGFDNTQQIRASIAEVEETIFVAIALVVVVIFLFLRDWRSTFIPIIVIPISLIGAFFIMYMAGFSINVLTLLAIVLAIGIVVDDAIVVLENIYARMESGLKPVDAGIEGTREIFMAVIATTIALAAVFLPIIFLGGMTGKLFREFGIVLAGSVIISAFVALTLTPMLSTRLLKGHAHHSWFYNATEPFFRGMSNGYRSRLEGFLKFRWIAPIIMIATGIIAGYLWTKLPSELAPMEDRSRFSVMVTAPEGTAYDYMVNYMDRLTDRVIDEVPEIQTYMAMTPGFGSGGANSAMMRVTLNPPDQRERTQDQIAGMLTRKLTSMNEARVFVTQEQTISTDRRGGMPVQFVLQALDFSKIEQQMPKFLEAAKADPAFSFVDVNVKFNRPELNITIDRERAQLLGVSIQDVAQTLQLALSESRLGYFIMNGQLYQIIGQVERPNRNDPTDLGNLYVRSASGEPVPLSNLISYNEQSSPPQLFRFNRYSSATISASLAPGYTLGQGIDAMERIADQTLDESFSTALAGTSRDFRESSNSLMFVFVLALILIYLVLSAQFESFRDPFTIMLTVPLAVAGALIALWYFDQTINIFSQIGLIMLIGLVTKNGILIVEFANQRREAGLSIREAVVDAAVARLRPVLMTTLSTILGILPIALALGAGAESRIPMGIAVIGGLVIGTTFTLFVIPAIYTYMAGKTVRGRVALEEGPTMGGDGEVFIPAEVAASRESTTERVDA